MRRAAVLAGAALAVLLAELLGIWVLGAVVAWSTASAVVLVGLWFAAVAVAAELAGRRARRVRTVLRVTLVASTALLLAGGAYTSLHETTVNETLEAGPPASRVAPAEVDDLLAPQP